MAVVFATALLGVVSGCGGGIADGGLDETLGVGVKALTVGALAELPLELRDVLDLPGAILRPTTGGGEVLLPGGASPAVLSVERWAADIQNLVVIEGGARGNHVSNVAPLVDAGSVRVVVEAGSAALDLPDFNLMLSADDGSDIVIYLPALALDPGEEKAFWVAEDGSSFDADALDTEPDFSSAARRRVAWALASDMKADVVARGFELPVAIAFHPDPGPAADDPLYYVVELGGTIAVVRRNGLVSEYASGLLNFEPDDEVAIGAQRGVTCAVVEPGSGDVLVGIAFAEDPSIDPTPHAAAVERFSSADGGLTSATRERIRSLLPSTPTGDLTITHLSFGPDGLLYAAVTGDLDATESSLLDEFGGKILRMTPDGAAPDTNPYYNSANGITAREFVYASGLRNVRGAAWRASDGAAYFVERGLNVDRFARLEFGSNYGWDGTDASLRGFALYDWEPARAATSLAFVQSQTFTGSGFPLAYQGRAYVAQSAGVGQGDPEHKSITEWSIGADGELSAGPRSVAYYSGSGAATAFAVAAGPDGLYFSELYPEEPDDPLGAGANIVRLSHREPLPPPDCNANGVPDADDLVAATSLDCNAQGVPDECDIASGRSLDCNPDGVPDECEATAPLLFDFSTIAASLAFGGTARRVDGVLELTPAAPGTFGIAVQPPLSTYPTQGFDLELDFRIGGDSGGDGMALAVYDASRYPDGTAFGAPAPGALVIELDTFDIDDRRMNRVNVSFDGQLLGYYDPTFDIEDDQFHTLRVSFDGVFASLSLSSVPGTFETAFHALEVPGFVPFVASYGFVAGNAVSSNQHRIDNLVLWPSTAADINADRIPDQCQCVADVDDGLSSGTPDGNVTDADLNYFMSQFGAGAADADIDDGSGTGRRDGSVNILDLRFFLQRWNAGC